jgi:hypothetical protein
MSLVYPQSELEQHPCLLYSIINTDYAARSNNKSHRDEKCHVILLILKHFHPPGCRVDAWVGGWQVAGRIVNRFACDERGTRYSN